MLVHCLRGPIPACAGEPVGDAKAMVSNGAYPRMRGGTAPAQPTVIPGGGLSPHARGNRQDNQACAIDEGPIPACAGEPVGEIVTGGQHGAYPRMRGGTLRFDPSTAPALGLSPHARGNRHHRQRSIDRSGPIPACAGEPPRFSSRATSSRAYPRMRGGTVKRVLMDNQGAGLSPHARGNRVGALRCTHGFGPIPACAGEPYFQMERCSCDWAYPRMRGGTQRALLMALNGEGLSPHARGNRDRLVRGEHSHGPIPACAGEPEGIVPWCQAPGAYPRMRGGTPLEAWLSAIRRGLSPHARGNPWWRICNLYSIGPIPACAGEPGQVRCPAA